MQIREWLNQKQGQVFQHKLDKVAYALELAGNPERSLPIIHVAGTNGKGSTIAFLSHLLEGQGFTVGTFVSPHMVTVRDRISYNGQPMTREAFRQSLTLVRDLEGRVQERYEAFSYFESLFLAMLLHFSTVRPDFLLVEVGIGGLSDVTNLVHPLVTVITSIGLDHQELLGQTLGEIAEQKAGIVKKGIPLVLGPMSEEAFSVCSQQAEKVQSPLFAFGQDFLLTEGRFYRQHQLVLDQLVLGLQGQHQVENAAVALETLYLLLERMGKEIDVTALQSSLSTTSWAGRLELIHQSPTVYLDGAHNIPGIQRLIDFINSQDNQAPTILFSALKRKDFQEMVSLLKNSLPRATILVTSFDYGGAVVKEDLSDDILYIPDYRRFLEQWKLTENGELYVTGSLYFISEVRKMFIDG